jgi:hypothetical protein
MKRTSYPYPSASSLAAAVALGTSAVLTQAADITGKITLKGTPPPETPINITDPGCGKNHPVPTKTRFYAVGSGGELSDVFVFLKDPTPGKAHAAPADSVLLDQKGCEYVPYVVGLQTKQKLMVRNSDPVLHNVHPTPTVAGNKEANKAQLAGAPDLAFAFDNPEIFVRFKCDVHPWMFSYVGVMDHPYHGVTGKDGSFKIPNVPPGKYHLVAFHRKTHGTVDKALTKEITVGPDGAKADLTIELKAP